MATDDPTAPETFIVDERRDHGLIDAAATWLNSLPEAEHGPLRATYDSLITATSQGPIYDRATVWLLEQYCGTLNVPGDAGDYGRGLIDILSSIPLRWLPEIRLGRGWYPIIVELHNALIAVDPAYTPLQVKEKFGELRYYYAASSDNIDRAAMDALVNAATERSLRTCERCGSAAADVHHNTQDGWYHQTLCQSCADARNQR